MAYDEKCNWFDFPPEAYLATTPYPLKAEGVIFDPNV